MTIKLDGKLLAEKDVSLAFGAPFGPDVQDVDDWCAWALTIVDRPTGAE